VGVVGLWFSTGSHERTKSLSMWRSLFTNGSSVCRAALIFPRVMSYDFHAARIPCAWPVCPPPGPLSQMHLQWRTHRNGQTQYRRWVPHTMHDLPLFHIIHLDHRVQPPRQHPPSCPIKRRTRHRLLMIAQRPDAPAHIEVPHA
jgi:hypothetical protein